MLPKDGKLHFSNLKHIAQSPAHYVQSCQDEREDTTSFRIGRAIHALVLLGVTPVVYSVGIRRGKEWEAFKIQTELNGGSVEDILNDTEYSTAMEAHESILACPLAQELLSRCPHRERSVNFVRNGIPCTGRIDAWGANTMVEIKTTACSKPKKFLYDANKFSYHAQMAWYDIGLGTKYIPGATAWRDQYIIAVETSAPYCVTVVKLDDLRIDQGHTLVETWLSTLAECLESEIYPSYPDSLPVIWDADVIIEEPED